MRKWTNKRELASAGLMMLIGFGTAVGALEYNTGSLARMGPGFFPLMLGLLLMLVAALIIATPVSPEDEQEGPPIKAQIRPWAMVSLAVIAFIFVGQYGGLVPAAFTLIVISAMGDKNNTLLGSVILAVCVTAAAVAIFHYGMQLQFPLFRWG